MRVNVLHSPILPRPVPSLHPLHNTPRISLSLFVFTVHKGDVDLCLVPEVAIELEGENGCLPFLKQRVAEQGHAVVVVAEGITAWLSQ